MRAPFRGSASERTSAPARRSMFSGRALEVRSRPVVTSSDPCRTRARPPTREVQALAAEAEVGYDVDQLITRRPKRGRPTLGSAPANVESVRLDPEMREELLQRARSEGTTTSEIIREALRRFLRAA